MRLADRQVRGDMANHSHCLRRMLGDPNPAKAARVMKIMLQMREVEVTQLVEAYEAAA